MYVIVPAMPSESHRDKCSPWEFGLRSAMPAALKPSSRLRSLMDWARPYEFTFDDPRKLLDAPPKYP
jgi:hypothetical protein